MPVLKTSEIRGAYSALRGKFHSIVDLAHLMAKDAHGGAGFGVGNDANGAAQVEARLYLQNWPYRPNSTKRNIDILIRVNETFSAASTKVMSSSARVSYFSVKGSNATPILEIHYDFMDPAQRAHPVFHAQFAEIVWRAEELRELGFTRRIKKGGLSSFPNHHIPTAFMGYGPILLAVVADHLDYDHHVAFLNELRENRSAGWGASCEPLRNSLNRHGGYLHSHHWY